MGVLANFSVKDAKGNWKNYTIAINDKLDKYDNNVVVYESQTKEQQEAKEPKKYIGNGKVFWTDGKVSTAKSLKESVQPEPKQAPIEDFDDGGNLPF